MSMSHLADNHSMAGSENSGGGSAPSLLGSLGRRVSFSRTASLSGADSHLQHRGTTLGSVAGSDPEAIVGSLLWLAPECLASRQYGPASDVWAFGICIWELATQKRPWEDIRPPCMEEKLLCALERGERPPLPDGMPLMFRNVIVACLDISPALRPEFAGLVAQLQAELEHMRLPSIVE